MAAVFQAPDEGQQVPTILLVEDEVLIRMAMADALRAADFAVIEAAHADEALAILNASVAVDLVITDIRMPGSMDGLSLVSLLRERRPLLKLAIMSGEFAVSPEGSAADLFLTKPCNMSVVIEKVTELLEKPK
jgi:YesN/AraC family two-component response regulator